MKKILVLICCSILFTRAGAQDKKLSDYGVKIYFVVDSTTFPKSWLSKEINGKGISLDSAERERSTKIIVKALNKYPVELIKKHLTKIYVLKRIEFHGQSYGGTNSTAAVYVSNKGIDLGYSDFWIEQAFHSELSSIFLRNFKFLFDEKKWISSNDSITYGLGGVKALQEGKSSKDFDFELNKKGVLSQYATASIEEDFNVFAENLFSSSLGFWEIGKSRERIKAKTNQVIAFYNQIDSRFTEAYFREISKK